MGCLFALLAALSPRLALILLWVFTNLVDRAFEGLILPVLGAIFFPAATLIYVVAYRPEFGVSGIGWFFVVLGFLFDLSSYSSGALGRRR